MPSCSTPDAAPDSAEARAAFHLLMRARGVRDLRVLRAFELVPRSLFVPASSAHLAARDLPLPIGCGQTMPAPSLLARMIEALDVAPGHHVFEIGSGTGFATAILATLAEEVIGTERFQSLAKGAQRRLSDLEIENAAVVWSDGLKAPPQLGAFDRIIAHGVLGSLDDLAAHLKDGGVLVCVRAADNGHGEQKVMRIVRGADGLLSETMSGPCRLTALVPGLAAAL